MTSATNYFNGVDLPGRERCFLAAGGEEFVCESVAVLVPERDESSCLQ